MKTERKVILPNNIEAIEIENIYTGGSETQSCFTYISKDTGCEIDTSCFKTGYWGRIENLVFK